jgi:hypothetical protein
MKKTARNDVTGDFIVSKPNSDMFSDGWDRIFGKKKALEESIKEHEKLYTELAEYELNKSTGEVQKVDHGNTTNTQE